MTARFVFLVVLGLFLTMAAHARELVTVRSGDHVSYSRLVFDFTAPPDYHATLTDDTLTIRIAGDVAPNFPMLKRDPLDRLSSPQISYENGDTILRFKVLGEVGLRHFFSGPKLVVDAVDRLPPDLAAAAAALSSMAEGTEKTAPPAKRTSESARPETKSVEPKTDNAAVAEPEAAPDPESIVQAPDPSAPVTVAAEVGPEFATLVYDWPVPTTAAAFQRAGTLWVVFEDKRSVDHQALDLAPGARLGERVRDIEKTAGADATVLRYRLRPNQSVVMDRDGRAWRLTLQDRPALPRTPLSPRIQAGDGGRVFVPADELGARLRLTDPSVGDVIEVVPLGGAGEGMAQTRSFAQFKLLSTAQGIAVKPLSEDVAVTRYSNGVAVAAGSGLALSDADDGPLSTQEPAAMIDLMAWGGAKPEEYASHEQARLLALSKADAPRARIAHYRSLARFYLGNGAASEAFGVLGLLAETDPDAAAEPEIAALTGVALVELGRAEEALAMLSARALDAEREIWLWRSMAAEGAGASQDALRFFRRGEAAIGEQPPELRVRLRLTAARAALEQDEFDMAAAQIALLQSEALTGESAHETDLLYGLLSFERGDLATARARFEDVAAASSRPLSARARLALVALGLETGSLNESEAIARLERLHFAWRGEAFEWALLRRLGRLQVAQGRYRDGLETLRLAASIFPDRTAARAVTAEMSELFQKLFLEGAANSLAPVAALGLFYDFRELTPLGAEGDRMIRRLVDRLVAVDLIGRAAELLEHQVINRLEGAPQALIAARLAKLYLLDGRPEVAVETLRATRQDVLPEDVRATRSRVEARALIALKRYDEAEAVLADDTSRTADLLRFDLYWGAQDWARVAETGARLLEDVRLLEEETAAGDALPADARRRLVRSAIALSFLDRRDDLEALRRDYGARMRSGPLAGVFDLITSADAPAGIAGELAASERFGSDLAAYRAEFAPTADSGS